MKKVWKRLLIMAAAVCLLLIAAVAVTSFLIFAFYPQQQIKAALTESLSHRLGQEVSIANVSIGFFPDFELVAEGLKMIDPETSETTISAANVRLDVSLYHLLKRDISIQNTIVNLPQLQITRNRDGAWNVEKTISSIKSRSATPEKEVQGKSLIREFRIHPIHVRHGTINVYDAPSGKRLKATDISLTLDIKNETMQLHSASIIYSPLNLNLTGSVTEFTSGAPAFDCRAEIKIRKQGPLSGFDLISTGPDTQIADIIVDASGTMEQLTFESNFSVNPTTRNNLIARGELSANLLTKQRTLENVLTDISFGKSSIRLEGRCTNLWSNERMLDLKGDTTISLNELGSFAKSDFISDLKLEGKTNGSIRLSGPAQRINIDADFDLLDAGLTLPRLMRKQRGSPASLDIDANYVFGKELVIDNFNFIVGEDKLSGNASLRNRPEPKTQAIFRTDGFSLSRLDKLPVAKFTTGELALDALIVHDRGHADQLRYSVDTSIVNGALYPGASSEAIKNMNATICWDEKKAIIESLDFSHGESRYKASGTVSDFTAPHISGTISTNLLNLNDIITMVGNVRNNSPDKDESSGTGTGPSERISLDLLLNADAIYAGQLNGGASVAKWQFSNEIHRFEPVSCEFSGGKLTGFLLFEPRNDAGRWSSEFAGKGISLSQLLEQFPSARIKARGELDFSGVLKGQLTEENRKNSQLLNGQLAFTAQKGEIKQSALLKTIFLFLQMPIGPALVPGLREISILNTMLDAAITRGRSLNPTTMAFERIDGSFQITDGIAHTEDLKFESGTANLTFNGDLNLPERQMDMKIRATPLGSIGSLIGKVPIAGETIQQAKAKTLSIDLIATGPIGDPKVRLASLEKLKIQRESTDSQPETEEQNGESIE